MFYRDNNTNTEQVFQDIRKNGKKNDWQGKKIANVNYANLLSELHYRKAANVKICAEIMRFEPTDTGHLKLKQTWFCKSKLCPLCNWRRSMKHSNQVVQVIDEAVKRDPSGRFLFWTLTSKNTYDGQELKKALSEMSEAFRKLVQYKKVKQNLLGFLRATEVTVNPKDNSYNQHMHVLVFVKSSYFKNSENYISQSELTEFWQKALQVDYTPIVNMKAVKTKNKIKNNEKNLLGAVYETAKYPVKSVDYLTDNHDQNLKRVEDLEKGLANKRLFSYGGLFKKIRKELQLADVEDEKSDLIETDSEDDKDATTGEEIVAYWNWERKNYFIKK
ncbi:protein rep [Enterococcus faecalis]|uniref:protein rep n=1 Tax=Enterococcus faecalis TaxID=1351 RepID=UPI0024C08230|nr:protein rep [Enterococcus faecalis]MDK0511654.1 protein rep [Enterococcus faecalis]